MAQLPEIKLTCRNEHVFTTRARGGSSVGCPTCRVGGNRVSVWVPVDRPKTARAASALGGQAAEVTSADPGLIERWRKEPRWDDKITMLAGRAGDECPECGGPIAWEPGRTLTFCKPCNRIRLPAAVAAHYQRQTRAGAEVATRTAQAPAASRTARVRLRALAQRIADHVNDWIEVFDPEGLNGSAERLALDYRAELAAYLPEIKAADDEAELAEIAAEVQQITERAQTSGVVSTIERQRDAIERQAELAERQAELAAQAEREARQAERDRAAAARANRPAVQGQVVRQLGPGQTGSQISKDVMVIAGVVEGYRRMKAQAAQKLEKNGPCGYTHRKPVAAERLYWIATLNYYGDGPGQQYPGAPSVKACPKHYQAADDWIMEQAKSYPQSKAFHTELK